MSIHLASRLKKCYNGKIWNTIQIVQAYFLHCGFRFCGYSVLLSVSPCSR